MRVVREKKSSRISCNILSTRAEKSISQSFRLRATTPQIQVYNHLMYKNYTLNPGV